MASGRGAGAHAADERALRGTQLFEALMEHPAFAPPKTAAEIQAEELAKVQDQVTGAVSSAGRIRRLDEKRFERLEETGLDVLSRELKNQSKNIIMRVIRDIFLFFYDDHVTNERERKREEREREIEVHSLVFIFNTPSKYYFTFC